MSLRPSHSFYLPRARPRSQPIDFDKPNFIYSSDIGETVQLLSSRYALIGGYKKDVVDLTDYVDELTEIHINIELNLLLVRNKRLRASDLLKENLIYLARTGKKNRNYTKVPLDRLYIQPQMLDENDIFVVSMSLKILDFIVRRHNDGVLITLDFFKDENYGILVFCDHTLISQLENYISIVFNRCLTSNKPLEPDDTPIRHMVVIDQLEDESSILHDHSLTDSTLQTNDSIDLDKSFQYDTEHVVDDDFETSSFDDIDDAIMMDGATRSNSRDDQHTHNLHTRLSPRLNTIEECDKSDSFVSDVNNLRHNESDEKSQIPPSSPKSPEAEGPLTRKLSVTSYASPKKNDNLSRKTSTASFSMIDYQDQDLDFAFKDKSNSVPMYIKDNKKFKFIKIGKVQKFVNLFEEKASVDSQPSSRCSSPLRR